MARLLAAIAIVALLVSIAPSAAAPPTPGGEPAPALVVQPNTFDFGILEGDVTEPFLFTLQNNGDAPLYITGVDASCGCTDVFLADSLLLPGGSMPLTGTFSTRKMEGLVRKTIFLETNDPRRRRAVLMLKSWVQRRLTFVPKSIRFYDIDPETEMERTVLFRPGSDVSFRIEEFETGKVPVRTELTEGERPGDLVLRVSLPPLPAGTTIDDTLGVRTTVEGFERILLPLIVRVRNEAK